MTCSCLPDFYDNIAPTPFIDQLTSKMKGLLKPSLTRIGAFISLFFNATKIVWHMGVQRNLHSFFVKVNSGFTIFTYLAMNLLYIVPYQS